ncbi:porin [Rheinheimera hassiensis]|uniref:porin n=1 Tax=Rheinheimera hassiensis TaxID=1193627 RepID=UPI001F06FAA8|nr:porin [Rheinheimera hassiensis]
MKMNKLAATILIILPVVSIAHAADYKIYGLAHVSVDHLDNDQSSGLNISSNSSRLGVQVSHEVESGLKVLAQIETLVRIEEGDTGSDYFDARDSYVGLQGRLGLIRIGYFDTPMKKVRSRTDFFGDKVGDARNIVAGGGVNLDKRFRNGIHYQSPVLHDMTFDLHYSSNDSTGSTAENEDDAISSSITYNAHGLILLLAYERQNQLADAQGAEVEAFKGLRVGARYKINDLWQVSALAQQTKDFRGGDRDAWGFGVSYKLNAYDISAQYYRSGNGDTPDSDANMLALGVERAFDKSLSVYAAIALTDNSEAASFNVSAGGHGKRLTITPAADPSAISVGAIYRF